ncbi:MAG: PaaI family thioesterase [Bacteroidetes bacterium]|nr:PaaI family thioesterase [Bacteroidota bacterium]
MRKIRNPFRGREGYSCFGCSPDHLSGLQLSFFEEGDDILSVWEPKPRFEGYHGVLHGGIQATIMDEIASWVVYVKIKVAGLTSSMNVRYHKPVYMNGGEITIRARVLQMRRNLADIWVGIYNKENELCSEGTVVFFTFSEKKSKESYFYPGEDAFVDDGS